MGAIFETAFAASIVVHLILIIAKKSPVIEVFNPSLIVHIIDENEMDFYLIPKSVPRPKIAYCF